MSAAGEAERVAREKRVIRGPARARRRELASRRDLATDAQRLAEHVGGLVARHSGGWPCRVAAYESYGVEPPTDQLLARLVADGHEVILPRMLPDRSLEWAVGGGGAGERGEDGPHAGGETGQAVWKQTGIPTGMPIGIQTGQPARGEAARRAQASRGRGGLGVAALSTVAVVITPGLAVDRAGTRLGQGGGSYDRALVHRAAEALVVTLLHDGELRDAGEPLPHSPLDLPVDGVVTADGGFVDLR